MTPAQKARKARWNYAQRAEQTHAHYAAYDALKAVKVNMSMNVLRSDWPVSGDDLALAKAGKIA